MTEIKVSQIDEVYCLISCDDAGVLYEINEYFTFTVPNARFIPSVRNKIWDGKVRLFNTMSRRLYIGLIYYLYIFTKNRNYKLLFDENLKLDPLRNLSYSDLDLYLDSLVLASKKQRLIPQDHQKKAIKHALNNGRALLLSPTGSGKSLIIYSILRKLLSEISEYKILIIVPTVGLVHQMKSDFEDYSSLNNWNADDHIQLIYSGQSKTIEKSITISTYQSLYKNSSEYFQNFDAVIVDECHTAKSASISSILQKCTNAKFRLGLTGTLNGMKTHQLMIEGLTGKVYKVASTKELIDKNILSKLKINILNINYSKSDKKLCKGLNYPEEIKFLISNQKRNSFITNLASSLKGNTLILYQFVDSHGAQLYNDITANVDPSRKVFFVHGSVDSTYRENVRSETENSDNAILVCSLGTFSQGINIKRLHNIIFASPMKGRIRVLQSIGRQLRKSNDKDVAQLYDICDDLSSGSYKNFSLKHTLERIKIYTEEHFKFDIKKINLE